MPPKSPSLDLLGQHLAPERLTDLVAAYEGKPLTSLMRALLTADLSALGGGADDGIGTAALGALPVVDAAPAVEVTAAGFKISATEADRPTFTDLNRHRPADRSGPAPEALRATTTALSASGRPLANLAEVAEEFASRARHLGMSSQRGAERVIVATLRSEYPEDRQVGDDPAAGQRLVDALTAPAALVASGGICGPVEALYEVPSFASAQRPVRDALNGYQATRGGIRFAPSLRLADVSAGVGIWTAATDATPGGATKPVVRITCPVEQTVLTDAITSQLKLGNFQARTAPERVAEALGLLAAVGAQVAENNLLAKISALATGATFPSSYGASRDIFNAVEQAAVGIRARLRMPVNASLTAILPALARDMIRADLTDQPPGDDRTGVTDAQIAGWFGVRNLAPVWSPDFATIGAQTPAAALAGYPATLPIVVFPSAALLFLDGGRLDLGLVRDTALNAVNDFVMFSEIFENVALLGGEVLKLTVTTSVNGRVGPQGP